MNKQLIGNVLKYLLAVVLLAWVIYMFWAPEGGKGLQYVLQRHFVQGEPIHWWFLAGAFFIYGLAVLITQFRWYFLVRAQDLPFTVSGALRIGMIGFFFNNFLPGSVGGDIVKATALAWKQDRRTVAVATVIMDRVIALWGLVWFVAILGTGFWLCGMLEGSASERSKLVVGLAAGTVVASLIVWVVMGLLPERRATRFASRLSLIPKVGNSVAEMWRAVWMYRKRQGTVFGVLALSWVGHVGFVLSFYCCANVLWSEELGPVPTLTQHFLLVPMGLVFQAIIPTPGGAGAGEFGFGGLYGWFAGPSAVAAGVIASLVQRIITWAIGLLGYLVCLRIRPAATPAAVNATVIPTVLANGVYAKQGEEVAR